MACEYYTCRDIMDRMLRGSYKAASARETNWRGAIERDNIVIYEFCLSESNEESICSTPDSSDIPRNYFSGFNNRHLAIFLGNKHFCLSLYSFSMIYWKNLTISYRKSSIKSHYFLYKKDESVRAYDFLSVSVAPVIILAINQSRY